MAGTEKVVVRVVADDQQFARFLKAEPREAGGGKAASAHRTGLPAIQRAVQFVAADRVLLNPAKPVPSLLPTQLLVMIEAVGICFSDTKLLHAFTAHPRKGPVLSGIDPSVLAEIPSYVPGDAPTVPGHEVCGRIVAVGSDVKHHRVGERVLVQTDYRHLPTDGANASFGYTFEGAPVTAEELKVAGAMTVLLKETLKPNLIQTLEGQATFMHCGPFGNIAHGNSSLIAAKVGVRLGDIVITEGGFASDLGMEKFLHIVCRLGNLRPGAVVVVTTVRALKHHGEDPDGGDDAIERGSANLERHIGIVREFGLKPVVAVNRRPEDTDEECELTRRLALDHGAYRAELNEAFAKGGDGAVALAEAVADACEQPNEFDFLYALDAPIAEKIEAIAKRVYRADGVQFLPTALEKIDRYTKDGLDTVPICMAKTHLSISHDPALLNAPTGFTLPVRDLRAYTGAGWIVALCGDMQTMPGYGVSPAFHNVDIDETGRTTGLF